MTAAGGRRGVTIIGGGFGDGARFGELRPSDARAS